MPTIRVYRPLTALVVMLMALHGFAQTNAGPNQASEGRVVEGANGTQVLISPNEGARAFQQRWGYAPAIRAGDWIYLSGVIAGPAPDEGTDVAAFERGLRRTFAALEQTLAALDASFEDVIKINTYHVFDSDYFNGSKLEHMEAVRQVKVEMMGDHTPTWSAIGVSELFSDAGLVEIELTVYAPQDHQEVE